MRLPSSTPRYGVFSCRAMIPCPDSVVGTPAVATVWCVGWPAHVCTYACRLTRHRDRLVCKQLYFCLCRRPFATVNRPRRSQRVQQSQEKESNSSQLFAIENCTFWFHYSVYGGSMIRRISIFTRFSLLCVKLDDFVFYYHRFLKNM